MAWQTSDYALRVMTYCDHLTPKEIGESFKGKTMPEDCVRWLLKVNNIKPYEGKEVEWAFVNYPKKTPLKQKK